MMLMMMMMMMITMGFYVTTTVIPNLKCQLIIIINKSCSFVHVQTFRDTSRNPRKSSVLSLAPALADWTASFKYLANIYRTTHVTEN